MSEQTHSTNKDVSPEETNKEIGKDTGTESTTPEESGSASGKAESEHLDFSQMYDMLTERDKTIESLIKEVAELKKSNTQLLLRVNASSAEGAVKTPYESFIDEMVKR